MEKEKKEISEKQMEKATGSVQTFFAAQSPFCKACGGRMALYGSRYRCITPGCSECGKDKTASAVNWK